MIALSYVKVSGGVGQTGASVTEIYQRLRKLKPLKVLAREVGVPAQPQIQVLPMDSPSEGGGIPRWIMYAGGGLVVGKLLKLF